MTIVIPRSTWKPRYSNGFRVIGTSEWIAAGKELWLHHSVTNPPGPDATLEQDCAHMRVFESIGQTSFGGGISYTWVVMPSGRVFQGHDIDRQGAHTYQRNNRSRAICLAGNFEVNALPAKMFNAVVLLLRELGATLDGPHSAVYNTACPGKHARARIQEMNVTASSNAPVTDPIKGDEEEMGYDFSQVKLRDTAANEVVEEEVLLPDFGGAAGVVARFLRVHGPGQPYVDSRQLERHEAIVELAHYLDGDGNIVGHYVDDGFRFAHHEAGPSSVPPTTANKLVIRYVSCTGLRVSVQVKTA